MQSIAQKKGYKPGIKGVLITPEKMVVTDSFRLIEYKKASKNGLMAVRPELGNTLLDGCKLLTIQDRVDASEFPDYEKIMPNDKPTVSIRLQASFLASLSKIVTDCLKEQGKLYVDLNIYDKRGMVELRGENVRGVLMRVNG